MSEEHRDRLRFLALLACGLLAMDLLVLATVAWGAQFIAFVIAAIVIALLLGSAFLLERRINEGAREHVTEPKEAE